MVWPKDFINKIIHGDCLEVMKEIPDESIDLIVTDPPYGYKFMGKDWDKAVIPVDYWKECLRVLKPGAFAFVMSAPRQDVLSRAICNLSDAGFRTDFTSIYWAYACISEDTEILTKNGFKQLNELSKNDSAATINLRTDEIEYVKILDKHVYEIDDELVNIKTKNTDQLVTKNHRILLKSKTNSRYDYKNFEYREAEKILMGIKAPHYLLPLARKFIGTESIGINFAELLGWIITEGHYQKGCNSINIYQSSVNSDKVDRIRKLLNKLEINYSEYKRKKLYKNKKYTEHQFCIKGSWNNKIKKLLPNKIPIQNLLFLKQEELQALFNGLIGGDGSIIKGKINSPNFAFWQKNKVIINFVQILATHLGYRTSINEKKDCLNIGWRSNTEIQRRDLHIKTIKYKGKVWSITTKHGNYIARRNGYVFITGNSGFPKASNISKLVNKRLGRKRKVVGKRKHPTLKDVSKINRQGKNQYHNNNLIKDEWDLTESASKEAKRLDGSFGGFQPKPAVEVIIVAMKPLSEKTFVDQALKNKHGITWLDDCKIPYISDNDIIPQIRFNKKNVNAGKMYRGTSLHESKTKATIGGSVDGRFPANLIVSNDVLNNGQIIKSNKSERNIGESSTNTYGWSKSGGIYKSGIHYADLGSFSRYFDLDRWAKENGMREEYNTFPFLITPKASKKEKNKGVENLEGTVRFASKSKSGKMLPNNSKNLESHKIKGNYHPTVKPIKLMSWLITLGSREGDIILDPFVGSGTVCLAAGKLKRKYIGIEKEKDYCKIANQRLWNEFGII